MPDVAELLSPADVHIGGWIGQRIDANIRNRLLTIDTEPLLAGYRHRPGSHPWIGEHVGKWLHAATLAWAYSGDPQLREKLDRVAPELIRCQEPDGYLGTYSPDKRFGLYPGNDWDVWSHKYNLIGLMTYYEYTGDAAALAACRKMADLLIANFPAKKSILAAGTHMGMAATSVLEPIVLLYRATGDPRYLRFARYIVNSWDEQGGPKIAATLLNVKQVNKTANGKAYEMLSNLVGLCELARATGDKRLLQAATNAWDDIVAKRLYITGSASSHEHFQDDYKLPNGVGDQICETCVTVTWMQLHLQLLRLTGESKYGDEFEKSLYNHLAAAQHPGGDDWCYYTALDGKKQYDRGITCCHSSGPRGMALAPQAAYLRGVGAAHPITVRIDGRPAYEHGRTEDDYALLVNTLETSRATLTLDGRKVTADQVSEFPRRGRSTITLRMPGAAKFTVKVRVPPWAVPAQVEAADRTYRANAAGWIDIPRRQWSDGDKISINFHLGLRLIRGEHSNVGQAALAYGPFVMAFDESKQELPFVPSFEIKPRLILQEGPGLNLKVQVSDEESAVPEDWNFVPFADAGASGDKYHVWLGDNIRRK